MPTFKKSKEKRSLFSDAQLQQALKSIIEDGNSLRKAAKEYIIPKSTLADYVKRSKKNDSISISKLSMTTKQVKK